MAGRVLRFAFLPPYLNRLTLSRQQLEASRGWELTRRSYREMQRLVRAQGGELVVLFIPSKAQVYLPLLEASFPRAELQRALRLCLGDQPQPPGLESLMRNRLALNDLMREFCAEEGITFLDLTAELQSTLESRSQRVLPGRLALECGRARDRRQGTRPAAASERELGGQRMTLGAPGFWTAFSDRGRSRSSWW